MDQDLPEALRAQLCRSFAERSALVSAGMVGDCDQGLLGDDPASAGDALERVRGAASELAEHARALRLALAQPGVPSPTPVRALLVHAGTLLLDVDGVGMALAIDAPEDLVVLADGGDVLRAIVAAVHPSIQEGEHARAVAVAGGEGVTVTVCVGATEVVRLVLREVSAEDGAVDAAGAPRARRVLVAEDNVALRELEMIALEGMFDEVLGAGDGEEALEILGQLQGEVDLLVLDLRMPRRNGLEVLAEAVARWPSLRVVVASGATPDGTAQSASLAGARAVLAKPFRLGELRAVVRSVLDGAAW